MATNNILPFCPTTTGTNLLTQAAYAAASDRTNGNQPGVASSNLVNKAMRQSSLVASQVTQFIADYLGCDILDTDGFEPTLLAQLKAAIVPVAPDVRKFTSSSGTYNLPYAFTITSGSATAGATYTNNAVTFTVLETVASGTLVMMSGSSAPGFSGTLTKTGGTGDATLTFQAFRLPSYLEVLIAAGGGGGAGAGSSGAGDGGTGGTTTFGSSLLTASGGTGGSASSFNGGAGGTTSVAAPAFALELAPGSGGGDVTNTNSSVGGLAGGSMLAGAGYGVFQAQAGIAGAANTGGGGSGAAGNIAGTLSGPGGGGGGALRAIIKSPSATYSYAVGAGGTAGTAGVGGSAGGAGGTGLVLIKACFQ